jgi:hypothetical protein
MAIPGCWLDRETLIIYNWTGVFQYKSVFSRYRCRLTRLVRIGTIPVGRGLRATDKSYVRPPAGL